MDCCFGSSRKAPRSISDAWTKQLSPLPGSHLVSTHTKLQFVDTDGFSNLSFQEKKLTEDVFNFNEKSLGPRGKNARCLCTESLFTWIFLMSLKLILIDDDSLPILPTTAWIQHTAMGSEPAVTVTWPSPWRAAEVENNKLHFTADPVSVL